MTRPASRRRSFVMRVLRPLALLLALASTLATFLVLSGLWPLEIDRERALALVLATVLLAALLLLVVLADLWSLWRRRRAGEAGARIHLKIVGLFGALAAVPALLVATVATLTLERGTTPWFSGPLQQVVMSATSMAVSYQQQVCQNIGRELRVMAGDVERAKQLAFEQDRALFANFFSNRAVLHGFPYAAIIARDGRVIERANTPRALEPLPPSDADFSDAATAEPPCIISGSGFIAALQRLASFEDGYLHVARPADERALAFRPIAEAAIAQYNALDSQRQTVLIAFAINYALITVTVLLAGLWIGLAFADRLVEPLRRLIAASQQVAGGNLYVQVPIRRAEGDMALLGETFNTMVARLRTQQNRLLSAGEALDARRRFIEAVLSSVSAGVVSLGADGRITAVNPTAARLLASGHEGEGTGLVGQPLVAVRPELAALVDEAVATEARRLERTITLRQGGQREQTLFVSIAGDPEGERGRGHVLTFDDITELVAAQRTSAWADVARRIAHEIKNPLTPIQLSAERIRRKYGKNIIEDREIFDQCIATITRQVDDIRRMVDEFSSFARMPKPEPMEDDLAEALRQDVFMMKMAHPSITFTDNLPDYPVPARFDRRLVGQAIQNLLKNASESIEGDPAPDPRGGHIHLALGLTDDGRFVIDVSDNGRGFPAENRQRLLEPYMTTRAAGTGLGLAIVAKIFEEHGGSIALLDNPAGKGALVRVTLPAPSPIVEAPDDAASATPTPSIRPQTLEVETSP